MENNHSSLTPIWNNNYPQSLIMPNYFNTCSNSSMDQTDLFESTLSSIVSSPVASNPEANGDMMIRELIGRLGTISNSTNNINNNNSTYNSTSSTPVNNYPSVPTDQFNMLPFGADPGFVERAARLSSLGNHDAQLAQFSLNNEADLVASRSQLGGSSGGVQVSMNEKKKKKKKAIRLSRASTPENGELGDSREESSVSEQIPAGDLRANARKRKAVPKGKGKDAPSVKNGKGVIEEQGNCKRSKTEEASGNEKEATQKSNKGSNGGSKSGSKENSEVVEAPKDYIHVRARRGQATDSHSLAERVRREKISERMKFLQDLVPGCNKVTGKAVMLDEIINYVQSLQRQVEFLSMKLATVNPRSDLNMEALLSKEILQSQGALKNALYQLDSAASLPFEYQPQQLPPLHSNSIPNEIETHFPVNLNAALTQNSTMPSPAYGRFGGADPQASHFFEDDLQSMIHMGFGQIEQHSLHGSSVASAQMKVEY